MTTPRLQLPEIAQGQSGKDITHNEALRALDAWTSTGVQDRDRDAPPDDPSDGDLHLVSYSAFEIVDVDTDDDLLFVDGDESDRFEAGDTLRVVDSSGNDGEYTVDTVSYDETDDRTELTLEEGLDDDTADGEIRHAEGDWNGHIDEVAQYDGAWYFHAPFPGARVLVLAENRELIWDADDEEWGDLFLGRLRLHRGDTLTIEDGEITVDASVHAVATEGGASEDDLHTINGGESGDTLYLRPEGGNEILLKHDEGNIRLKSGSDLRLRTSEDTVQLLRLESGYWADVGAGGGASFTNRTLDEPETWTVPNVSAGATARVLAETGDLTAGRVEAEATQEVPSDPVTDDFETPSGSSTSYEGIVWRESTGELILVNGSEETLYILDGFSDTVIDSYEWKPPDSDVRDADLDGDGNLIIANGNYDLIRMDGLTDTILDQRTQPDDHILTGICDDPSSKDRFISVAHASGTTYIDVIQWSDGEVLDHFEVEAGESRICVVTGDLWMIESNGTYSDLENDEARIYRFDGISGAVVETYLLTDNLGTADNLTHDGNNFLVGYYWNDYYYGRVSTSTETVTKRTFEEPSQERILPVPEGLRVVASRQAWPITDVDTGADTLKVGGDQTGVFEEDDEVEITGSTGNDGTYTLTSRSWAVEAVGTTDDYFELSGDQSAYFEAGETFEITGSTDNDGTYTVASVEYDEGGNGNTRVYTEESVEDSTADGDVVIPAVRYYSGDDETQLQTSESLDDSTADGDVEMWKGTAYASVNWGA